MRPDNENRAAELDSYYDFDGLDDICKVSKCMTSTVVNSEFCKQHDKKICRTRKKCIACNRKRKKC